MQVETFECQETAAEPIEACEEAVRLAESLGLEGQLSLVKREQEAKPTRSPYREMTGDEEFVYRILCPDERKATEYAASPMPLRILQVLAHARECGMFDDIVVWDRTSAAVKDPVLVGVKKDPAQTWRRINFILARWGEHLESFPILLRDALNVKRTEVAQAFRSIAARAAQWHAIAQAMTDEELIRRGWSWKPYMND